MKRYKIIVHTASWYEVEVCAQSEDEAEEVLQRKVDNLEIDWSACEKNSEWEILEIVEVVE